MPKVYYFDMDSTLINSFVRENIETAVNKVRAKKPDLKMDSRAFSQFVVAELQRLAVEKGVPDTDVLLNQDALLPLFQSLIDNGGRITVLSAGLLGGGGYSEYLLNSSVFHITNAYLDNVKLPNEANPDDNANFIQLDSQKIESFYVADEDKKKHTAYSLSYLKEEMGYGPQAEIGANQDYHNRYKEEYPNTNPECDFEIKDESENLLQIHIDVERFLKAWSQKNRPYGPYGKKYIDEGKKFLIVMQDLFRQGIKVDFQENKLTELGLSIIYPENWVPKKILNPQDIAIVDDNTQFLQFFNILNFSVYVANTGDAKKDQLKTSINFPHDYNIWKEVKNYSEATMQEKFPDENLNSFVTPLLKDYLSSLEKSADNADNNEITILPQLSNIDASWEQSVNTSWEKACAPPPVRAKSKPVKPEPSISKGEKAGLVLSTAAGAVGGAAAAVGLGGLFVAWIKTTTLCMGAGALAGSAAGPVGTIVCGLIGAAVGTGISLGSTYGAYKFFRSPPTPKDPEDPAPGSENKFTLKK